MKSVHQQKKGVSEIEFIDYLDRPESSQALNEDLEEDVEKVAVIYVEGTIIDGWGDDGEVVGGRNRRSDSGSPGRQGLQGRRFENQ